MKIEEYVLQKLETDKTVSQSDGSGVGGVPQKTKIGYEETGTDDPLSIMQKLKDPLSAKTGFDIVASGDTAKVDN